MNEILRNLPKIDKLMQILHGDDISLAAKLKAARDVLAELRRGITDGDIMEIPHIDDIVSMVISKATDSSAYGLHKVINATGIVLHTNLGRAPLAQTAAEHVKQAALGYNNLEYDLLAGRRGSRTESLERQLTELCGCEAAVCVNNNAAAVLLILSALCDGGQVVVSRGELVEIGGSFRIPEIISQGGAVLKEIGTTNKVRLSDYENAMGQEVSAILKVHTSNYRIVGYTEEVNLEKLASLACGLQIPLIYDLGGGSLIKLSETEPIVQESAKFADILSFSGDKLLGGPQAGIIVGKKKYIDKLRKHPLYRALRIDKLSLAALEATLKLYQEEKLHEIPAVNMLTVSIEELRNKADILLAMLKSSSKQLSAEVIETSGQAGGGSLPAEDFPSFAVAIEFCGISVQNLENRLRNWDIPIITRIHKNRLLLDIRTIDTEEFDIISKAVKYISDCTSEEFREGSYHV